jgi:hypothetical protein
MKWMWGVLVLLAAPVAFAEPWLCTGENGVKAFNYDPASAGKKNCVDHPIPSGNVWRVHPRSTESADFPRVDGKTQRQRDAERRRILERELAEEKKSLQAAMKQLEAQKKAAAADNNRSRVEETLKPLEDKVRTHQTNIGNLRRELGEKS